MELGGKDPAIVCSDADVDRAARSIVWGAFANSGQICASVERVYVHDRAYDDFVRRVTELTRTLRQGDPLTDPEVDVGAMTEAQQIGVLEEQIARAVDAGARVLVGGRRSGDGCRFFEPTVIVDVTDRMDVMREESFGPLLPIMKVESEEEAIARANDSRYGLSAYVFTGDRMKGRRIAESLEAGTVMVNDTLMTHGFPETPWGGVKESGVGRVHSDEGLRHLTEAHHVNEEVIPLPNPVWYPYGSAKTRRFLSAARLLLGSDGLVGRLRSLRQLVTGT
jgi:succinate-semialdehyde dehydrogenase/glutarate-semialdehyde dehydrogenase